MKLGKKQRRNREILLFQTDPDALYDYLDCTCDGEEGCAYCGGGKPKKNLIRAKMRQKDFICSYPECECEYICRVTERKVK